MFDDQEGNGDGEDEGKDLVDDEIEEDGKKKKKPLSNSPSKIPNKNYFGSS